MTPRRLDWRSVQPKLRTIEDLLDDLRELGPITPDRLRRERPTALAVERVLTLLVELAFAINSHVVVSVLRRSPDTYADSFLLAAQAELIDQDLARRLLPSARMRNVLVHAYLDTDLDLVTSAVPLAIDQYGEYARQVARFFAERLNDDEESPG